MEKNIGEDYLYLIRVNGEIVGFVEEESKGVQVIRSMAATEVKKLENTNHKITRQDFKDSKEIHISTQSLGAWYNGKIKKAFVIDMIRVANLSPSKSF